MDFTTNFREIKLCRRQVHREEGRGRGKGGEGEEILMAET